MAKRLITLMAALLMLGFVATGCGDDDSSGDSADTTAQTVTDTVTEEDVVTDDKVVTDDEVVTDTETVTDPDVTSNDNGGAAAVPENREQAVASCKKAVTSYPQISADTESDLEDLCEKAASGDEEQAREAGREVCKKIVDDVYPSGVPGKDKALNACQESVK
jgi:hypothetical protein